MTNLVIEILSQPIPASMQKQAQISFKRHCQNIFAAYGLEYEKLQSFVSAYRLAIYAHNMPTKIKGYYQKQKGPHINADEKSIAGFLKKHDIQITQAKIEKTPSGEFFFYENKIADKDTKDVIAKIIKEIINARIWNKTMYWLDKERNEKDIIPWIRPIVNILAIFGEKNIKGKLLNLEFNNKTFIYKASDEAFFNKTEITIERPEDYEETLKKENIIIDRSKRIEIIKKLLGQINIENETQNIIEEWAGISENPLLLEGKIRQNTALPHNILRKIILKQNYIPKDNNSFIFLTTNDKASDAGRMITKNNEKILEARIADIGFYLRQNNRLEELRSNLKNIIYHDELGDYLEKSQRIKDIARIIAADIDIDEDKIEKISLLCKADLAHQAVREMPELQGLIGAYLARKENLGEDIAKAIETQYNPDPLNKFSTTVFLANALDNVASFASIKKLPSGTKDPLALRRNAHQIIKILCDERLGYGFNLRKLTKIIPDIDAVIKFISERLQNYLHEKYNLEQDIISAILNSPTIKNHKTIGLKPNNIYKFERNDDFNPQKIKIIARTLNDFMRKPESQDMLAAYLRVANIIDRKTQNTQEIKADIYAQEQEAEKNLSQRFLEQYISIRKFYAKAEYEKIFYSLAGLKPQIDEFFDNVRVNVDRKELKQKRLKLLGDIKSIFVILADFSYLTARIK